PPRGYLIVRTALSYNNLDRAERKGTLPSKAVPESPDFGTRSHYARRGLGSDDLQHLPANDNDGNGQSDQGNAGSDVSVTNHGEFSIPPCRHMPVAREMGQRRPRSRAGDAVLSANGVCA